MSADKPVTIHALQLDGGTLRAELRENARGVYVAFSVLLPTGARYDVTETAAKTLATMHR